MDALPCSSQIEWCFAFGMASKPIVQVCTAVEWIFERQSADTDQYASTLKTAGLALFLTIAMEDVMTILNG